MNTPLNYLTSSREKCNRAGHPISRSLSLAGLGAVVAGLLLFTQPTHAQTTVTEVKDSGSETVFQVFDDGALLGLGEFETGVIPKEGPGTRMMWYPAKAAFRAGRLGLANGDAQWDASNIGNSSVAFGFNTKASSNGTVAMGRSTTANGIAATAMGDGATASGFAATSMGSNTTAIGSEAVAMGDETTANESRATAMGSETTASGLAATAMGLHTTADTENSLSIGECNNANTTDDNTLFVAGNGTFDTGDLSCSRSDALVLDDAGNMTISGSLTQNSDRRLKKNITPLEDGVLGKLGTITPSQFQFNNQQTHPAGPQVGLIAQEVQKQFPELVSKAGNGYLSVSYSKFTAVLLKGMQEQQQQIEQQKYTIHQLKKETQRIAALEQKVAEMSQDHRMAGLPLSTLAVLFASMIIGGGFWWRSCGEQ